MKAARLDLARATGPLVALGFFVACAVLGARLSFLHDEGIFTYDLAAALPRAVLPMLFFLRAKALLVLLYALPARAGLSAFMVAHAAVAAAGVLLTASAARRLGLPRPDLAAWTLAASPGFFVAAGAGFPNSDGAFFLALFLWLYAAGRRAWAGLALGALPFVRFELAFATAVFLGFDLWRRRDLRFALAVLGFPAAYALAGAAYHRDLLWPLHTFPNLTKPADIMGYQAPSFSELWSFALASLVVNFSALGLVGLLGWDRRDRRLDPLFAAAAGTWLLLLAFAGLNWFGVDRSLRYHVAPLPLVALLAASWRGRDPAAEPGEAPLVGLQVAGLALALALTPFGREQHLENHRLMEAVRSSGLWHGQPVYTDVNIARLDACAGVDAWMLANESILYEVEHFVDPDSGQRRALVAAMRGQRIVAERGPELRRDALYLLEGSERERRWREHVEAAGPVAVRLRRHWLYGWGPAGALRPAPAAASP